MTRSYIVNEVFHIETNDETIIDDLLDRLESHIYEDVEKQEYKKAGERIGAYIEMDENFDQWRKELIQLEKVLKFKLLNEDGLQ